MQAQRILIVDDNETNRDILEARLTAHGYEVLHAGDGEEALAAAKAHRPDLILLDVMMPKLDGFEVCRRLKSDPAMSFVPIILVTAKAESKDVVDGLDAGADEYLTKPIDQKALVARVKALLRLKAQHEASRERAAPKVPGATDLFLSYSRQDTAKIEALAATLQQAGWSVWWDWVRAEAAHALESNKLLPIRLDKVALPLRFIHVHTIDLSSWSGSGTDPSCQKLVAELHDLLGKPNGR